MDRFKKIYQQGTIDVVEIWVDTQTGVNYVFHRNGNAAGFTPLLDKDGKPVVSQQCYNSQFDNFISTHKAVSLRIDCFFLTKISDWSDDMNDIFKDMQAKVGCEYISDLPFQRRDV